MKQVTMNAIINAPASKVWKVLWDDDTYPQWTSVFGAGSRAESDWEEGSKILFLDGKGNGMVSYIDKKTENQQMTFRHMAELKDGVEKESSWAGAIEDYQLEETDGTTELTVILDAEGEMEKYFVDYFPKAFAIVKELAEG
jgi:uncharacterized protein YndB with AHSA1/START domain